MRRHRTLHPAAWWGWALGLAVAASRTTNLLVLGLIVTTAGIVVARRRDDAPWSGAFITALWLGAAIVVVRVILQIFFGPALPGPTVLRTPEVPLPGWAAGVRLGGTFTLPSLVLALREGLQLATIVAVTGAANALASPARLLRALPGVLYEAGVALTVAVSFAPQMMTVAKRIRRARRLRGRPTRGPAGLRGMALPVLEGALEQAVDLAAAMDSRGYGRRGTSSPARVRTASLLLLGGLLAIALGTFLVLDQAGQHSTGVVVLILGAGAVVTATALGSSGRDRTRYRPDPFGRAEWLVVASGAVPAAVLSVATSGLIPDVIPLQWPTLPAAAFFGVVIALIPAVAAPRPLSLIPATP